MTKQGYQYILTVVDPATRYPDAFPLKSITTKSIVKPLLHLFTSMEVSKVIQSDQGSNFTSKMFNQVLAELGIKHVTFSAYHPQSQGCLEKYHQTIKNMLRKYCHETGTSWDTHLDWLMFAIREANHDALGVSPFELLFGQSLRGPLKVLKNKWFDSKTTPVTVNQYLSELVKKSQTVNVLAKSHLFQLQDKTTQFWETKAVSKTFKEGQQFLSFLPSPGNPPQKS